MRLTVVLALSLVAIPCARCQSGTYTDPQHRYTVSIPSGWRATQLNSDAVQFSNGTAYLTAMVLGGDPATSMNALARQTAGQWRGFAEANHGAMRLAGRQGSYATYSGTNPAGAAAYLILMSAADAGRTFLLMESAPQGDFGRIKPGFDEIERSLRIAPPEAPSAPAPPPVPAGAVSPSPRPAPAPPPRPVAQAAAPAGSSPNYYRMKKATVMDQHGFERPMPAMTLLIPTDWRFEGNVQYSTAPGCPADLVKTGFRASSPDGRFAIEMFPGAHWQWADDPNMVQMLQASNRQSASFGGKGCDIMPAMAAAEYLRRVVVPHYRSGAQIAAIDPMPDVAQKVQEQARQQQAMAQQQGIRIAVRADSNRLRISRDGFDEWITGVTFASGMPAPSFNMQTGQMGQTMFYTCGAYVLFALRAPQGQLPAMEKFFTLVLSTVRVDPQWESRVTQVVTQMNNTNSRAAAQRSAIVTQNGRDISDIINRGYEERSRMHDSAVAQFDQYIRGVESYRNPSTGETVELSNQYGRAWSNGLGEYVLSDSPSFQPGQVLNGSWTELQHVKP